MAQPKNAIEINYISSKTRVICGEDFRYAEQGIIENAKQKMKECGKILGYFDGADLYILKGSVARFNGGSGLKLLSETKEGIEELVETLGLPK